MAEDDEVAGAVAAATGVEEESAPFSYRKFAMGAMIERRNKLRRLLELLARYTDPGDLHYFAELLGQVLGRDWRPTVPLAMGQVEEEAHGWSLLAPPRLVYAYLKAAFLSLPHDVRRRFITWAKGQTE